VLGVNGIIFGKYAALAAICGGLFFLLSASYLLRQGLLRNTIRWRESRRVPDPNYTPLLPPDSEERMGWLSYFRVGAKVTLVLGLVFEVVALVLLVIWLVI
jgi:hypothetical protein